MSDLLGTTLQDLLGTLKARRVRVPSEIGAFVALEVCESLARGPARVATSDVRIADDGSVSLFVPPNSATHDEAARAIVGLLASVLVAAGTGAPAALIRLVEDGAPTGAGCLDRLRDDLEAALVPLNRQAARRVLARMVREARREAPRAASERPGPAERLDRDLDDLLEPAHAPAAQKAPSIDPIDALLRETEDAPATLQEGAPETKSREPDPIVEMLREAPTLAPRPGAARSSPQPAPNERSSAGALEAPATLLDSPSGHPSPSSSPQPPSPAASSAPQRSAPSTQPARPAGTAPARGGLDRFDDLSALDEPPKRGGVLGYVAAFLVVAALSAAALAILRPDLVDRLMGRPPPPPPPAGPTPEEREAMARAERGRYGAITVTSTPPAAQVFLFVGRSPAEVEDLTPGVAYEMMALVDGRAPSRVILPADAAWEAAAGGPSRYELALQVPDTPMSVDALVLGDTTLPDELGTPRAELGIARVITSPPGAKVYLLVGFTPDVRVENVSTEEIAELLVWAEGYELERLVVAPSDWRELEDGSKATDLSATLREARRRR